MYVHITTVMIWQTRWSPRALTVVSTRKLEKTGAQLRDNRRSAKNDAICVKKPVIAAIRPLLKVEHLSLLRAGMSTEFAMT